MSAPSEPDLPAPGRPDTGDWPKIRALFEAALDLPSEERAAWIAAQDVSAQVRRAASELLDSDARERGEFDPPQPTPVEEAESTEVVRVDRLEPGARLGGYRIVRRIASGGMGDVYLAEQNSPQREVALKVLRARRLDERSRRRFQLEAELLGRLQHPNIAQVFEAGLHAAAGSDERVPYFALEYVRDCEDIVRHATSRKLSLRARVELFLQVCDAVQFAHEQGVIHRDLKPSNLLVGHDGRVKLIDFGIAREEAPHQAGVTQTGELLGTLAYMSPERLEQRSGGDDARSDVYAMGVVLYELLVGAHPIELAGLSLVEATTAIRDVHPRRPSDLKSSIPEALDWVCLEAVAPDRGRRFATVSEFSSDLRRWLEGETVLAGAPSRSYRMRSFMRRHRVGTALTSVALSGLIATVVGTSLGMRRAREASILAEQESQRAQLEAQRAREVEHVLTDALTSSNVMIAGGNVRLSTLLQGLTQRIERDLGNQPDVATTLHRLAGQAYMSSGQLETAREQLLMALELAELGHGSREDLPMTLMELATVDGQGKERERAIEYVERARALARADAEIDAHARAAIERRHAWVLRVGGRQEAALESVQAALEFACSVDDPGAQALALLHVGTLAASPAEALRAYEEGLALVASDDSDTYTRILLMQYAARIHYQRGEMEKALSQVAQAIEVSTKWAGSMHPQTLDLANDRAIYLSKLNRLEEAAESLRPLVEGGLDAGLDRMTVAFPSANFADMLHQLGRLDESLQVLEPLLPELTDLLGAEHSVTLQNAALLAILHLKLGHAELAQTEMEICIESMRSAFGATNVTTILTEFRWGEALALTGDRDAGLKAMQPAVEGLSASLPAGHPYVHASAEAYVRELVAAGLSAAATDFVESRSAQAQTEVDTAHVERMRALIGE